MEILMRHEFLGNVRELENIIEYGFVLCHNRTIDINHLPEELQQEGKRAIPEPQDSSKSRLTWAEADAIRSSLQESRGHLGRAAKDLGISRTTLWRKMKKFSISAKEY